MTEEVRARAQELFRRGCSRRDVAERLGVRYDTLRKAINQGRLRERSCSEPAVAPQQGTDKSERSVAEGAAELGVACPRPGERILAALGKRQGAPTRFEKCR